LSGKEHQAGLRRVGRSGSSPPDFGDSELVHALSVALLFGTFLLIALAGADILRHCR
jgi:hypothetical protein